VTIVEWRFFECVMAGRQRRGSYVVCGAATGPTPGRARFVKVFFLEFAVAEGWSLDMTRSSPYFC